MLFPRSAAPLWRFIRDNLEHRQRRAFQRQCRVRRIIHVKFGYVTGHENPMTQGHFFQPKE
jgi:hypothetical protein